MKKTKAAAIITMFCIVEFIFSKQLNQLGTYASYIFEAIFVLVVTWAYRSRWCFNFSASKFYFLQAAAAFVSGFGIYKIAGALGLSIPFDLKSSETIVLLLLIGPILEESVFRQALWWPFEDLLNLSQLVVLASAAVFAFAHFFSYFLVPPVLKEFVIFQTVYVFLAGIWWGLIRRKYNSIVATIPIHILFNFGFFCGFLLA